MKKLYLFISSLLAVGAIFLFFFFQSDKQLVKEYVKNEYGLNVKIKEVHKGGFVSNEDEYIVFPKKHHDLVFSVIIEDLPFSDSNQNYSITDNYSRAVEVDEEFHKLDKIIPSIEKLDFQGFNNEDIKLDIVGSSNFLHLNAIHPIDIFNFEAKESDRFYKLLQLIKQSGALIHKIYVMDMVNDKPWDSIEFNMENLMKVNTKEEFLLELKKSNEIIASVYEGAKWKIEKKKIENQHVSFGSPIGDYKNDHYWFQCSGLNEKEQCNNIFVRLIFAENSLTGANPHLDKDLNLIFSLFEKQIAPNVNIRYYFEDALLKDGKHFTTQEIAQFESISAFINAHY